MQLPLKQQAASRLGIARFGALQRFAGHLQRSPAELQQIQWRYLGNLLRHAAVQVPYYREVFKRLGASPGEIRTLDDFRRLPVLTKEIIVAQGERMIARDHLGPRGLVRCATGGSTGAPLTFFKSRAGREIEFSAVYRSWLRGGWRPGERIFLIWGGHYDRGFAGRLAQRAGDWLKDTIKVDAFQATPAELRRWVALLQRQRPRFVRGYASSLELLARHLEQSAARIPPLTAAFSTAERLHPQQREVIERGLGCRVFDQYGCQEAMCLAAECAMGKMHLESDYALLETTGGEDEEGDVLLTNLHNRAMPLIRYRNGDRMVSRPGRCACGLPLPVAEMRVGRLVDNFVMPSGKVVHGEYFTHLMYAIEGVQRFQWHQVAADRVILRVVRGPSFDAAAGEAIAELQRQIHEQLDRTLVLEVHYVDAIPLRGIGKHLFTISDLWRERGAR